MKFVYTILLVFLIINGYTQVNVAAGSIRRYTSFPSVNVDPRNIDVWLPPAYDSTRHYPVVYMHDGQMLFDSSSNWNHQEWKVDETLSDLISKEQIRECIIVGIWNNGEYRKAEFFPENILPLVEKNVRDSFIIKEMKGHSRSNQYQRFIVKELKPFIDSHFSTLPDRKNTFIAGSSSGGIASLYAICLYPDVYGAAACLSTHWPGSLLQNSGHIPKAVNQYLKKHLPAPASHRIYFDYGDATLDSQYHPWQIMVDRTMKAKGFNASNWETLYFPGENHSERAWAKRLDIPFIFLLGKRKGNYRK